MSAQCGVETYTIDQDSCLLNVDGFFIKLSVEFICQTPNDSSGWLNNVTLFSLYKL